MHKLRTIVVHTGDMKAPEKAVRESVSLPIGNGIDAERKKQQEFFALADRFRNEEDPETASRLGDELGQMVFGAHR